MALLIKRAIHSINKDGALAHTIENIELLGDFIQNQK